MMKRHYNDNLSATEMVIVCNLIELSVNFIIQSVTMNTFLVPKFWVATEKNLKEKILTDQD